MIVDFLVSVMYEASVDSVEFAICADESNLPWKLCFERIWISPEGSDLEVMSPKLIHFGIGPGAGEKEDIWRLLLRALFADILPEKILFRRFCMKFVVRLEWLARQAGFLKIGAVDAVRAYNLLERVDMDIWSYEW